MKINKKIIMAFKKTFALFVAIIMCFSTACGSKSTNDKINIVCTIFPQYDFVRQLTAGMDNVEITMLLKPGQESHDYDPSSKDVLKIHNADVFIYVGGESDTWIKDVLSTVDNKNQVRLALMDMVDTSVEEELPGIDDHENSDDTHDDHDHSEEYDEHVWTSPANAVKITNSISSALSDIEGMQKDKLTANTDNYVQKLNDLDKTFKDITDSVTGDTIIVADRFPLLYFCKEYDIKYYAAFSGCATSVEPSTSTLIFLIDKVNELKTPYIFSMEMSAATTAKHIAAETGAEVLTFYPCHNITSDDLKAGVTYIDLMNRNAEALKKALNY